MQSYLEVFINNLKVGEITLLANERNLFVFDDDYLAMKDKPILSQSFFDKSGEIIVQTKIVQTKLPPFFLIYYLKAIYVNTLRNKAVLTSRVSLN